MNTRTTKTTANTGGSHVTDNGHPETAFQFRAAAPASIEATDGKAQGKPRKFAGTPYSGNAIAHRYWGQVVFDLSSTRANEKTPVLVNHDPDKRCGFAALTIAPDAITISDGTLMPNERGMEVAMESDAGFPWQMSVFIQPGSIEELKAGTAATINGRTVQGPATVFRNNLIREVSFTPTGVDNDTEAAAFSARGASVPPATTKETTMNEDELKAKIAGLEASVVAAEAKATAAETALAEHKRAVRASAVKELFSAIGREHTDESAAPYMDMSDMAFSAVSADLKARVQDADKSHLFADHATSGTNAGGTNEGEKKFSLNPIDVYAARRAQGSK
jgi:hypothetical protein